MTIENQTQLAAQIKNLEIELLKPATRHSLERLNELLADDFMEIGASGKRYNKQDVLNVLPASVEKQFVLLEFEVKELSPQIVLATYRIEKEITGSDKENCSLRSSVWQKQNGQWRIIFHQGTSPQQ